MRVARQARESIMAVGRSSVSKILLSMHNEELGSPSPYAKELCDYLNSFRLHINSFSPFATTDGAVAFFLDYVIELFLINASLLRPTSSSHLKKLSEDLRLIAQLSLAPFKVNTVSLSCVQDFVEGLCMPIEELAQTDHFPFWAVIQLLISQSEATLLSPHKAVDWSLQTYVEWLSKQTMSDRFKFLSSVIESYTSSVISHNRPEYVSTYPLIMNALKRVAAEQ